MDVKGLWKLWRRHALPRVLAGLALLWIGGTIAMWLAENTAPGFSDLPHASWSLMVYLTSGFEGDQPTTPVGKFVGVVVVLGGIALVGVFTASIASLFVEQTIKRGQGMESIRLKHHIVICGWNRKAESIVRELHADVVRRKRPIVIVGRDISDIPDGDADAAFDDVYFVAGDPTAERVLHRANVKDADTAIVLADRKNLEHADAQSILIALAIESINPAVHTCVEVVHSENLKHFNHTKVDECISMDHLGELLLAQAALNHGVSAFFTELLTVQEQGNEIYRIAAPARFVGRTFQELARCAIERDMIAVGIEKGGRMQANPARETRVDAEDYVLVMARAYPEPEVFT